MIDEKEVFAELPPLRESTVEAILDSFPVVLWYKTVKGAGGGKEYWCSRCGAHKTIRKAQRIITNEEQKFLWSRHGFRAECPSCGRTGILACIGTARRPYRYRKWHWFLVVQPVSERDVWVREICAFYFPGDGNGDIRPAAKVQIDDRVRYRLSPGEAKQWAKRSYLGWSEEKKLHDHTKSPYPWGACVFRPGASTGMLVEGDLSETFLRYNSYEKIEGRGVSVPLYLANYALYPSMEMMVKAGFDDFVIDLVENGKKNVAVVDWNETDPRRAFRTSKEILEKLRKCRGHQVKMLQEYHRYRKRGERDPWHCAELIWAYRPLYGVKRTVTDYLKESGTTEIELYKYFEKIREQNPGCHMNPAPAVDRTWKDYIEAAGRVGYDLSQKAVIMPRDLYGKHNEAVDLRNELFPRQANGITPKLIERFEARAPKLQQLYGKVGAEYFIRIPQTPAEVVAEGQALHHCVGGYSYIGNHATGKNPILFLRRTTEPDVPFYTMEVNVRTNEILQCEGGLSEDGHGRYGHIHRVDLPPAAKAFLDEWESERVEKKKKKSKETKTA